jgi:hypothetical protein
MSFDVQLIIVLALIALAAAYVLRASFKTWFGTKAGCGSGCGKCAAQPPASPQKGRIELPQI